MLSHRAIAKSLDSYVDGTLPHAHRAEVDAHLRACAECRKGLNRIHRLDLVLDDLPSPPEVPFPRFWSKLDERLANRVEKRAPIFRPGRLAAAFALAVLASLIGLGALASDAVMPDSPLYAVKHVRQEAQLVLSGTRERPRLELAIARQRLYEALVMVQRKRPDLALASIEDFHALLDDATSRLEMAPGGALEKTSLVNSVGELEDELAAVRGANIEQEGIDANHVAALDVALQASMNAVNRVTTRVDQGGASVVESQSAEPSASDASPWAQSSPAASAPPPADSASPSDSSASVQPASSPPQTSQPAAAPSPPDPAPEPTD